MRSKTEPRWTQQLVMMRQCFLPNKIRVRGLKNEK